MFSNPPPKHTLKGALDSPQPRIPVRAVRSNLILSHSTPRSGTSGWENHQPQSLGRHVPTFLQACNVCSVSLGTLQCLRRLWASAFSPDTLAPIPHLTQVKSAFLSCSFSEPQRQCWVFLRCTAGSFFMSEVLTDLVSLIWVWVSVLKFAEQAVTASYSLL